MVVSQTWLNAGSVIHVIFITQDQFWPSGIVFACIFLCVCTCVHPSVRQPFACLWDDLCPIQVRITKFVPEVQNTLFWVVIDFDFQGQILTWNSKFNPFWACPRHNSSPLQALITKFSPEVQNALFKTPFVLGWLTLVFKIKFNLKNKIFQFHHYWKYITTPWPPENNEYLNCFKGLTVSWSSSSAHTYIPRPLHGPDGFTVSNLGPYTDLASLGYFSVQRRCCKI